MNKPASKRTTDIAKEPSLGELQVGSAIYQTRLTSKFRNRIKWERPDENMLTAVIPGTIQQIMVEEGTEVVLGTPILILEAMKMRNEIVSPVNGSVKRICVSEGEQVSKDHLMVEFL